MARPQSPIGVDTPRVCLAMVERLEDRRVPTSAFPISTLYLGDIYSQFTGDLGDIERHSKATPAEFLALRNDALAISAATASTTLALPAANTLASEVTLQLDRSTLDGWLGQKQWAAVESRLVPNLQGLGASPALIARTVADMQAVAASARVSPGEYNTFENDFNNLRADEEQPGASSYDYPDPELYFAQHLIGFFRGGVVDRAADESRLDSDLESLSASSAADPAGVAVVRHDAQDLEKLGAAVSGVTFGQFLSTYESAFSPAAPSPATLPALKASLLADLGPAATASRTASVDRLVSDAPAFFASLGSSPTNVRTLAADVQAVVNDGVGSTPDPFKVTVARG